MFIFVKAKWQKDFDQKREEMVNYYETKKVKANSSEKIEDQNDQKSLDDSKATDIHFGKTHCSSEEAERYEKTVVKNNYAAISSPEKIKNDAPSLNDDYSIDPYEIDPREFGAQEMYGMLTFRLFNDGDIVDDKYMPLDEETIDNYIGNKNLEKLASMRDSDPEMDSFYVRNDRLKIDCEILIESGAS